MDNNGFLLNNVEFTQALHNLWRGIINPNNQNHEDPAPEPDSDDLPPLEPINTDNDTNSNAGDHDLELPPLEPSVLSSDDVVMAAPGNDHVALVYQNIPAPPDDDQDSMPDLQSISDSSSEEGSSSQDAEEVAMMQDLQPVEDDNDSEWTDEDDDHRMPPLEPMEPTPRGNRRVRVEDDQDEDRDRRHPSQRTGGTDGPIPVQNAAPANHPPFMFQGLGGAPRAGQQPDVFRLFQHFFRPPGGGPPQPPPPNSGGNANGPPPPPPHSAANPAANPAPNPGGPNPRFFTAGFAVVLDMDGNPVTLPPGAPQAQFPHPQQQQPHPPGHPRPPPPFDFAGFAGGAAPGGGFLPDDVGIRGFAELFERFGAGLQAMGLGREEQEDPDRAKKLVAGLEEVPIGLVKRMERVGGAPGAHVDGSSGEVEVPGCAICWDKLLDAEGEGFKAKEPEQSSQPSEGEDGNVSTGENIAEASASSELPSSSNSLAESSSTDANKEPEHMKIVSLPCAHVFHASCLIPWFSRPRQTTCPTCRFNIDPENLTYVRRPRPPPQPAPGNQAPSVPPVPPTNFGGNGGVSQPQNVRPDSAPVQPQAAPAPVHPAPAPFQPQMAPVFAHPAPGPGRPASAPPRAASAPPQRIPTPSQPTATRPGAANPGAQDAPNFTQGGGFFTVDFNFTLAPRDAGEPDDAIDLGEVGDLFAGGPFGWVHPDAANEEAFMQLFGGAPGGPTGMNNFPPGFPGPPPAPVPGAPGVQAHFHAPPQRPPRTQSAQPREKREWTPPAPPGPSLRQRVEQNEREAGLRCLDISCGIGPSDEEPFPDTLASSMKQLSIRPLKGSAVVGTSVCTHTFHSSCLVSAERVAGWGGEDKPEVEDVVEVSCPICRAVGCVSKEEWKEGVTSLV